MIISEKQILQLITIAYSHIANCHNAGEYRAMQEVSDLIGQINEQQSTELKEVKGD